MDNIEDILKALAADSSAPQAEQEAESKSGGEVGGFFDGIDPEALLEIMALFDSLSKPNDNERFLLSLKPLLREENRAKIDTAVKLLKIMSLLPLLKDSGLTKLL